MTNEEYITAKRRAKFNLIWNSLINKLPKSSQKPLENNSCAFNSQLINHKEQYVICRRVNLKDSTRVGILSLFVQIYLKYSLKSQ